MKHRKPRTGPKPATPHGPWTGPALIVAVLVIAAAARVYYFVLTNGQPVWWDEAEYLIKARSIALGTPDTGYFIGRPILLPLFMAGLYAIGLGETAIRVAFVLLSLASVYLTYRIGRRLLGELAGAVAALLFSFFYIQLFFTSRIMTEIPQLALCLLAVDLFLAGTPARTVLSMPVLVLGGLTRFPSAILLPILLAAAAIRERTALLRNRALWLSFGIATLVGLPYLLWAYHAYGDPLAAWHASQFHIPHLTLGDRLSGTVYYLEWLRESLGWMLSVLAAIGLVVSAVRAPLVVIWALAPIVYFGAFLRPLEDRFVILALPPLFIAIGWALEWVARLAARKQPRLQTALVAAIAIVGAVPLLGRTDSLVHSKLGSYGGLRDAGLWLRQNTTPDTTLMSTSAAQVTYYSERPTLIVPKKADLFTEAMRDGKARYVVLSAYEQPPGWMRKGKLESFGLKPVVSFPAGRPEAIVFTYR